MEQIIYSLHFGDEDVEVTIKELGPYNDVLVESIDHEKHFVVGCARSHPVHTNWMWVQKSDLMEVTNG
jgi:hypothetical protein